MGSLKQPDKLTALSQFVHSPCLTIHAFSLLHPLSPPPKSSLSVDDLAFYLGKTKATRRKPQQTPTISAIHLPEPAPTHSTLYPSKVKQCLFPCALNAYPVSPTSLIFFLYWIILTCKQICCYICHLKIKTLLTLPSPFLLDPLCTKPLKTCLCSHFQFLLLILSKHILIHVILFYLLCQGSQWHPIAKSMVSYRSSFSLAFLQHWTQLIPSLWNPSLASRTSQLLVFPLPPWELLLGLF